MQKTHQTSFILCSFLLKRRWWNGFGNEVRMLGTSFCMEINVGRVPWTVTEASETPHLYPL